MNRCRDYFGFTVWFAGIGYAVLWPLSADGIGGYPFGASVVCGHWSSGVMPALCDLPRPLTLPVGLHLLGLAAAVLVAARLLRRLLRRVRPRAGVISAAALAARLPGALAVQTGRKPARPVRKVTPRTHFGLRGMPR